MSKILAFVLCNLIGSIVFGQNLNLDGYVYESGNRGFLNVVQVTVKDKDDKVLGTTFSDNTGHFEIEVPARFSYTVHVFKEMFEEAETEVRVDEQGDGDKIFLKIEMSRAEGYIFEISLAEKREHDSIIVDAIKYARIEVYNNTKEEEVLLLDQHPDPNFNVALKKGNHYTILVRKSGYLGKRMEAFVDVEGCILCFEGIGSVNPGVTDNLSDGNKMGVLLANVELDKIYEGKTIPISNILYETGKSDIKKRDEEGLLKLATVMKDNPDLTVEIGSHTDSNGDHERNFFLSQDRAQNVVAFLVDHGVSKSRLVSRGYGEDKLLNECDDSVYCTERQHRINRRTELKVIGIAPVPAPIKSLAQIKQMEQGEALLSEIQFGEQIQVPIDSSEMDVMDKAADMGKAEEVEDLEEETKNNEAILKETSQDTSAQEMTDEQKIKEKLSEIDKKKHHDTSLEQRAEVAESESVVYRIVIEESSEAISKDSDLFTRHSNLNVIKNEEGNFVYMIGGYDNEVAILNFFKTVKIAYEESYPVKVVNGIITKL